MKHFLRSIFILLVFWALFFNIDRLTALGGSPSQGLHPFIFWLLPLSNLAVIFIPYIRLQKTVFILLGAFILFLTTILVTQSYTIQDFYLIATEFFLLMIAMILAKRVGNDYLALKKSIENVILPKHGHRIYDDKDMARRIIEHEFIRGRRYNHPITALVVEPNAENLEDDINMEMAVQEIQQIIKGHYLANKLIGVLENETRLTDLVVEWDRQGRFVIVCPETTAENSMTLVDRLQAAVKETLGISITYGIASFPNDARTFDAVLEKAESQLTPGNALFLEYAQSDHQLEENKNRSG